MTTQVQTLRLALYSFLTCVCGFACALIHSLGLRQDFNAKLFGDALPLFDGDEGHHRHLLHSLLRHEKQRRPGSSCSAAPAAKKVRHPYPSRTSSSMIMSKVSPRGKKDRSIEQNQQDCHPFIHARTTLASSAAL
ncbi:hypothetical protein HDK90DRAFT_354910 [Phyllosticta capitalensis]|uniref:Uncharacterized protein n=1 Tax=Phyllosticta capitalensis TaxID=121624 RepID=A0ABR1YH47_9PEZI